MSLLLKISRTAKCRKCQKVFTTKVATRICTKCLKSTLMAKKLKKKEKKANSPTAWKKKLDALWRKVSREVWGEKCTLCGATENLNIHHFIGRRNYAVRWSINNAVPLCPKHHTFGILSAHQDPDWFGCEMVALRGDEWKKNLRIEANEIFDGNYQKTWNDLTEPISE